MTISLFMLLVLAQGSVPCDIQKKDGYFAAWGKILTGQPIKKAKERCWMDGKVLDYNSTSSKTVIDLGSRTTANTTLTSPTTATTTARTSNNQIVATVEKWSYVFIAGNTVYICQQNLKWRWSKEAQLTVNGPVRFAIQKDKAFVLDEEGKEREMKVTKKILLENLGLAQK